MSFIESLKMEPGYIGSNGRVEGEIAKAEKELNVSFAQDYREYLKVAGLACFAGHEFTGLTATERLNVVSVTKEQRSLFGEAASTWYVVEEANIDGIVIWQDAAGAVYQTVPNSRAEKIADSLAEYLGIGL